MQLCYLHHGNRLIFRRNADRIQLLGLFGKTPLPWSCLTGGDILQIKLTTSAAHPGLGRVHTLSTAHMQLVAVHDFALSKGDLVVIILKDPATGVLAEVNYLLDHDFPTIKMWIRVRNDGPVTMQLHLVRSIILHNLGVGGAMPLQEKANIYLCQCQGLGSERWWRLAQCKAIGSNSWSRPQVLPVGLFEDVETGKMWYWYLGYAHPWDWALGETTAGSLSLWANLHTSRQNGCRMELAPGCTLETDKVAFGLVPSSSQRAWKALGTRWRQMPRPSHCPSIMGHG